MEGLVPHSCRVPTALGFCNPARQPSWGQRRRLGSPGGGSLAQRQQPARQQLKAWLAGLQQEGYARYVKRRKGVSPGRDCCRDSHPGPALLLTRKGQQVLPAVPLR